MKIISVLFFPFFLKSGKLLLLLSSREIESTEEEVRVVVIGQITLLYQTINHCAGPATTPEILTYLCEGGEECRNEDESKKVEREGR